MTTMNTSEKLWNYFKRNDDSKIGECKLCNKSISYASTITNLKIHLKLKHIEAYEVLLAYRTPSPEPPDVLYTVKKTSKNISANIWNYFERNDNTKIAKCNLCFKSLSYKSTSGNLRPHLSHKHPEAYQDFLAGRMLSLESRCKDSPARSPSPEPPSISNTGNTNSRNSYLKIWDYFKRNQRTKIGICNLCSKSLSYKTTTTNLKKHLMHKHIEAYKLLQGDPDDILNTVKRNSQNVSSNMWNYFQRNRRTRIGKCKLCNKLLSYKTSVTNLKKHLKHKHIEVYKDFQAERSPTPGPPCTLNTVKTTRKTYNRLWNYFQRNQNTKISKCNLCGKTLSYRSTVTNLRQHLQLKHIEAYEDLLAERTASPEPADILNTVNRNSRNSYIKLWNYFQRNQGTKMGTCNLCSKSLSYKTSSTNLRKHLKHKHIDAYEDLLAERTASPNPRHRDSLSRSSPEPKYEYSLSRSPSPESTHVHSLSRSSSQESRYTDPLTRSSPEPKGSLRSSSPKPRDKCSPLRSSFLESTYKDTVSRSPSESRYKDSPSRSPSPEAARWYRKGQLTKYFEYLDTKEDRARCNTCGGSYQFRSTVANLKAHLKKVHPDLYRELRLSEGAAVEDLDAEMDDVDVEKRPQRTIDLSEYFEKYEDDEDSSVTCILCKKSFSEESETTLAGHLFAEHSEQVEVRRSRNRSRPSEDAIWDFFEVLSCIEQTAKCNYCEERGSFANGNAELAIHLSRAHPDHFETYMERRLDMSQSDDEQSQRNRERAQRVRRRGKRSVLWEHFDAGDGRRALCRHCGHSISYKSTTGNLWLHLRASHPHQHALIDRDKRATGVEEPKEEEKRARRSTRSTEAAAGEWSDAWQHFSRTTGGAARCALCRRTAPPTRERMHLHLRTHHKDVWERKAQDSNNAEDTTCLSPSQNSDTEDHLNGSDSFANNQEDHITNDNIYTEIVYLDEEEKANRKPVKAIKRRRETLAAIIETEPGPQNQLSTFINYIHCLMKQLPDDVSSKTQMEIINVIMAAKLNSDAMMATTSHAAPERKFNISINTDGTSPLTEME